MDGSPENNGTQDSEDEDEDDPDSRRRAQVRKFATAESTVMPKVSLSYQWTTQMLSPARAYALARMRFNANDMR